MYLQFLASVLCSYCGCRWAEHLNTGCRMGDLVWVQRERVWRTVIANHDRVLCALQEVPGIQLKMEGLHDVPLRVLTVRSVQRQLQL